MGQERKKKAMIQFYLVFSFLFMSLQARTEAGDFGTSTEQQEMERKRRKEFSSKVVPKLKSDLRINTQTYQVINCLCATISMNNEEM